MKGIKSMKNEITIEMLVGMNQSYHQQHGVTESDLNKCLEIVKVFDDARDSQKSALAGDVVILKGTKKTYENGHIEGVNVWGMTGNGAFHFPYEVKVWELESLDIY